MNIKPDTTVVVYKFNKEIFLKSAYSKFEVLIKPQSTVAYIEDYGILCYGYDMLSYSMDNYMKDILYTDIDEMDYIQYIYLHKEIMYMMYPDAPLLNAQVQDGTYGEQQTPMDISCNNSITYTPYIPTSNDISPQPLREIVVNNNSIINNLQSKGINAKILKG